MDFVRIHVSHTVLGRAMSLQFNGKTNALVALLCLTLCDSIDCSPPGSSVYGILQAGILEWIAISFSRYREGKSKKRNFTDHVRNKSYCLGQSTGWDGGEKKKVGRAM